MISVTDYYKWSPHEIERLYYDDAGVLGIKYWYEHLKDVLEPKNKKK